MLWYQIRPHNKQHCVGLSIAFTQKNSKKYHGACFMDYSYVYKGVPQEHAMGIIHTIYDAILQKGVYPQCDITFGYGANCEVALAQHFLEQ